MNKLNYKYYMLSDLMVTYIKVINSYTFSTDVVFHCTFSATQRTHYRAVQSILVFSLRLVFHVVVLQCYNSMYRQNPF